jgi:hypothetical protein
MSKTKEEAQPPHPFLSFFSFSYPFYPLSLSTTKHNSTEAVKHQAQQSQAKAPKPSHFFKTTPI